MSAEEEEECREARRRCERKGVRRRGFYDLL
jgi:hypothetical protein